MKNRLFSLCLALLLAVLSAPGARAAEEILDWHSEITVHQDGSMDVTETVRVRAEGDQIRRGIYRDFPTIYRDRFGNRVVIDFEILSVKRDGRPEPYHTEKRSNGVRTYVGRQDIFLQRGEYTYDIAYRTDRQLGFFEDHDELYWNVTGNDWGFPILEASATVSLPAAVPAGSVRMAGYVGFKGSLEQSVTWEVGGDGKVTYTSDRPLGAGEGLTLVLGWPKGYVAEPGRASKSARFLLDNRGLLAALAGLLVLLAYYLWAWRRVGKDPEGETIIPRFEPPDNLSPAAMRYIMEMGFDNRAFTSAVINLAVKGHLTITDEAKAFGLSRVYTLHRVEDQPGAALSSGEQKVFRRLFPGSARTLKLESQNHKTVSSAMEALKDLLKTEYQKATFANNSGYMIFGVLISAAAVLLVGASGGNSSGPPILFIVLWFVPWTAATLFLWASRKFLLAVIFTFFLLAAGGAFSQATSLFFLAALVFFVLVNFLFYVLLKAPTRLGRRIMDRVEGFKMYLSTAEEHRLEKLHPPEKTPELFERYLPYALALEVDQEWSEKFTDVLTRAAAADNYSPGWYHGRHWNSMRVNSFASGLGSSLSSAISSSSTAPGSSSGFGGGGGSGGGGGGGGGGGW